MKKIIFFMIIVFIYQSVIYSADQSVRKIEPKDYFEINCSLSGGMRQVIYDKYLFTFIETIEKKVCNPLGLVSASLQSFVEIQKKTELNKDQEQKLRNWLTKYNITSIKPVPKPEKEDMGAIRYTNHLMVYIDAKEYNLDHHTIGANPELQQAFAELFAMAKEFTETANQTSPANSEQKQKSDSIKKVEADLLQENLDKATTIFAHIMRNEKQFAFLAQFSNHYPKRYAILMKNFEEQRRQGNNGEDLGFKWEDEPETSQNKSAITKWNEWFKNCK